MAVGMKLRSGKILKAYVPKRRKRSGFKKAVIAIAKKMMERQLETKNRTFVNTVNFGINGANTAIYVNVAQGTDAINRIGDQIRSLGVKWRGYVCQDPAVITTNKSFAAVRMMLVSGKRPLTSGDMPSFKGAIDPEILTVHYDRYVNFTDTDVSKYFNLWVPFRRVVHYAGGQPTKNELYLWFISDARSGATTTTGFISDGNIQLYWKDS